MNTAIYSPSGASAGIGFAIPVDTLKQQAATIIKYGRVLRPAIGISYAQGSQARALGVQRGVLVITVPPGSNAEKAGLRGSFRTEDGRISLGDVITAVNGVQVRSWACGLLCTHIMPSERKMGPVAISIRVCAERMPTTSMAAPRFTTGVERFGPFPRHRCVQPR
jgi:Trypsin-like serine proteases, typically periplasmic, contain C-terminal PDZ domain